MKIGDRVFSKNVLANGVIVDIDDNKKRDKYKVKFFWAKYCDIRHGEWRGRKYKERKWQWCSEADLLFQYGGDDEVLNYVTSIGNRSLDRLYRDVCEIPRRRRHDGSDIVIVYGQGNHNINGEVPLVLNERLVYNKYTQMQIMGDGLVNYSQHREPEGDLSNWIIKPENSMGGRNIRSAKGGKANYGEYYQKKFDKVREYRAHVFLWNDEPVPFIQEKICQNPGQLCWNKKQGGSFRYLYQQGRPKEDMKWGNNLSLATKKMITKMSVAACKKLNYDLGGVDLGMDKMGNMTIFEVNSRMGLREQSLFSYKNVFNKLRNLNIDKYKAERWA